MKKVRIIGGLSVYRS